MGRGSLWSGIVDRTLWLVFVDSVRARTRAEAYAAGYARAVFRRANRLRAVAALVTEAEQNLAKGKPAIAEALYRRAAEAGSHQAVVRLVNWSGIREDRTAVEAVYRVAVAAGDVHSLSGLALVRARQGDTAEARELFQQAIEVGCVDALTGYAAFLRNFGDPGEASKEIQRCREEMAGGETRAVPLLGALLLTEPDCGNEAEAVLRRGAELLENRSRALLAALLLDRGAVSEASELVRRLRATGDEHVRLYAERLAKEYALPA
ncbi:hypothetical protein [Micromonospora coerulea]|uniref:hypothetical protein n=1 Tax=Micromonospora coerulea TaxID=47856 RepID=UPI0019030643|nr:hypothetical protein [Micromonospora veneta]